MTLTPATIRDYDNRAPDSDETETATFALGCFWGPDAEFGAITGVVRTRVGYAGGTKANPSYHDLGDHTEVFQVDYDPEVVSYTDFLARVFRSHDPRRQTPKTQYQNIVFAATAAQRDTLHTYLEANSYDPDEIETRIEQLSRFYLAEDYHQKHSLRAKRSLMEVFEEAGYDDEDLRESPAAAKLNGHAAGREISAEHGLELPDNRTIHSR
ncbi:peptide-methionine (S)-S-oxide reductase MsrA [Halosegnis sp.]|uniref:peptide-methionine (S)-S-oxide reductase MsrA n=1 Tax=Halosegnis sp. TaxID=2864959 RepID=UPI0035D40A49